MVVADLRFGYRNSCNFQRFYYEIRAKMTKSERSAWCFARFNRSTGAWCPLHLIVCVLGKRDRSAA